MEQGKQSKNDHKVRRTEFAILHIICLLIILSIPFYLLPKYINNVDKKVDGIDVSEQKFELNGNTLNYICQQRMSDLGEGYEYYETPDGLVLYYPDSDNTISVEYYKRNITMYNLVTFSIKDQGSFSKNKDKIDLILQDFYDNLVDGVLNIGGH